MSSFWNPSGRKGISVNRKIIAGNIASMKLYASEEALFTRESF